jgi:hypothetical protein
LLAVAVFVAAVAAMFVTLRWQDAPRQRFADRLGAPKPGADGAERLNLYFGSRIARGRSFDEVSRAVPPADRTRFLLLSNGSLAQHLHYALPRGAPYDVYVVFANGRVVDVEFAEHYLGKVRPVAPEDAVRRIRQAIASPP